MSHGVENSFRKQRRETRTPVILSLSVVLYGDKDRLGGLRRREEEAGGWLDLEFEQAKRPDPAEHRGAGEAGENKQRV